MNRRNTFLLIGAIALFLLPGLNVYAHDPFDGSARMTVRANDIELTITFGAEAARRVLSGEGFSKEEIANLMKPRGPRSHQKLPASVAARFFEIRYGEKALAARSATLLSDGVEVIFTVIYPRPAAGNLEVRAKYYDQIEEMRQGAFVAHDENGKQLGFALLSRASGNATVTLPKKEANADERPIAPAK